MHTPTAIAPKSRDPSFRPPSRNPGRLCTNIVALPPMLYHRQASPARPDCREHHAKASMTEIADDPLPRSAGGRSAMDVALEAARIAGSIIRGGWDSQRQISFKGRTDIVTDVDFAAEKAVLQSPHRGLSQDSASWPRSPGPYRLPPPIPGWWTPWTAPATTPRASPISPRLWP